MDMQPALSNSLTSLPQHVRNENIYKRSAPPTEWQESSALQKLLAADKLASACTYGYTAILKRR